jgi:hypothetical protein
MAHVLLLAASLWAGGSAPLCNMAHDPPIRALIRQQLGAIRACYESALQANPRLGGRVSVGFTAAGSSGDVVFAELEAADPEMESVGQCVVEIVGRVHLPLPPNLRVVVSYPFLFERAERDRRRPPAALPRRRFATPRPLGEIFDRSLLDGTPRSDRRTIGLAPARVPSWLTSLRGPLRATAALR